MDDIRPRHLGAQGWLKLCGISSLFTSGSSITQLWHCNWLCLLPLAVKLFSGRLLYFSIRRIDKLFLLLPEWPYSTQHFYRGRYIGNRSAVGRCLPRLFNHLRGEGRISQGVVLVGASLGWSITVQGGGVDRCLTRLANYTQGLRRILQGWVGVSLGWSINPGVGGPLDRPGRKAVQFSFHTQLYGKFHLKYNYLI